MTRVHLTKAEFTTWIQDRNPDKYELYRLPNRTVAMPTVSTRPVLYGICEARIPDELVSILEDKGYGPVYETTYLTFSTNQAE